MCFFPIIINSCVNQQHMDCFNDNDTCYAVLYKKLDKQIKDRVPRLNPQRIKIPPGHKLINISICIIIVDNNREDIEKPRNQKRDRKRQFLEDCLFSPLTNTVFCAISPNRKDTSHIAIYKTFVADALMVVFAFPSLQSPLGIDSVPFPI